MRTIVHVIMSAAALLLCNAMCAVSAYAQATPLDQYRQMAGIAAIAEVCYGSKAIPTKLTQLVHSSVEANPAVKDMMVQLLAGYNVAYKKAIVDHLIWNGSQQSYSGKPFSCASNDDIAFIKKLEGSVMQNLAPNNT